MGWLLSNPQLGLPPGRLWPELQWWPDAPARCNASLKFHPSLPSDFPFTYQSCASGIRSPAGATESTRRTLVPSWSRTARAFRRWMLPTVERGPPGHGSVWTSVCRSPGPALEAH